jgi:hypothetical protein
VNEVSFFAARIGETIYVLYEANGRFEHEEEPLLEQAVYSVAPSGHYRFDHRSHERAPDGSLRPSPPLRTKRFVFTTVGLGCCASGTARSNAAPTRVSGVCRRRRSFTSASGPGASSAGDARRCLSSALSVNALGGWAHRSGWSGAQPRSGTHRGRYAALDVASGQVIAEMTPRHRADECNSTWKR